MDKFVEQKQNRWSAKRACGKEPKWKSMDKRFDCSEFFIHNGAQIPNLTIFVYFVLT